MRSNFPSRPRHSVAGPTDASVRWSAVRRGANVRFRPKADIGVDKGTSMRALAIAVLLIGGLVFFWGTSAYVGHLASTRPREANIATGHTIEMPVRGGSPVFISNTDRFCYFTLQFGGLVVMVGGALAFRRNYPSA